MTPLDPPPDRPRALVYGPYPPAAGPAAATLAAVRGFLAGGYDVVVVSPIASGAHHHADLQRITGALRLSRLVVSAERVVLYVEPGQLCGSLLRRRTLPAGRLAVGLALRRPREVVVHCGAIGGSLDPQSVRVVLGPAERVIAASADDRDALVAAGLDAGKVEVAPAPPRLPRPAPAPAAASPTAPPARQPWPLAPTAGRDEIQVEIRRRATRRGGVGAGAGLAGDHLPGTASTRPLLALRPLSPIPPSSTKPLVGLVKRLIRQATAWQVDPVVDHVNRLQRATLEAIENQGRPEG